MIMLFGIFQHSRQSMWYHQIMQVVDHVIQQVDRSTKIDLKIVLPNNKNRITYHSMMRLPMRKACPMYSDTVESL